MSTMQVHRQPSLLLNYMLPIEIRPYARQEDKDLLRYITPVKIIIGNAPPPRCDYNLGVPTIIFSSDCFTGNLFHEFNKIITPLFLTSRLFQSRVQFIIVDYKPYFVNKYSSILSGLSNFLVLNPAQSSSVHCFPGAVVGLKFHKFLGLNPSSEGYSMPNFKQFLRETYNLETRNVDDAKLTEKSPVLILVARENSRKFVNEDEIITVMEELGFQVIIARSKEMSSLDEFSRIVGSCSVLVGAHGAGLAIEIFLPLGAVTVQVIPLGLEWASRAYFGDPAEGMARMGINYLGYRIGPKESTLIDLYGPDHPVIKDPASIFAAGCENRVSP